MKASKQGWSAGSRPLCGNQVPKSQSRARSSSATSPSISTAATSRGGKRARGPHVVALDGHVVAAVLEGRDFGILPLVAVPRTVRAAVLLGPGQQARRGLGHAAAVGIVHANVRHCARGQLAQAHLETVGVLAGRQAREIAARARALRDLDQLAAPLRAVPGEVVAARRRAVALLEGAAEVRRGGEAALQRDLRQRARPRVGHQGERPLEPRAQHELVQRLAHQGLEHAVEMEGREARRARHLLQRQRPCQVRAHVVERAVHAREVVALRRVAGPLSQDPASAAPAATGG